MALRPTMVQLPEDLVARADRRAAHEGISRSRLIREALAAYLAASDDEQIARAYEDGYGRMPFGAQDEWGDVAAFHDALARERHGGRLRKRGTR